MLKFYPKIAICFLSVIFEQSAHGAAAQILNDNFFLNPAELSLINKLQLTAGNTYLAPKFQFNGVSYGNSGKAISTVNDSLPYFLGACRLNNQLVLATTVTPSSYGHLNWPVDSIVSQASTLTKVIYYRIGAQASYQVMPSLALGFGLNMEYNKQLEINYLISNTGNQTNQVSAKNATADFGLFYKINSKNFLTAAVYSSVNTFGQGISSLGNVIANNFSLTISEAPVAYIGLQHLYTDKWFFSEKIYWSGWSLQKNVVFQNSATGTFITPSNWRDVWSFQFSTRYSIYDQIALLGFLTYETNPIGALTNQVGYPLAPCGSVATGLDISIKNDISTQLIYGYAAFLPAAQINNSSGIGTVSLNTQSFTLQIMYKI